MLPKHVELTETNDASSKRNVVALDVQGGGGGAPRRSKDLSAAKYARGRLANAVLVFLLGVGAGCLCTYVALSFGENDDSSATSATNDPDILTSSATTEDFVTMGMDEKDAECVVTYRESAGGILLDPMDLLDHDVDIDTVVGGAEEWSNNVTSRRRRRATSTSRNSDTTMADVVDSLVASGASVSGALDGVDPSSDAFMRLAESTVQNAATSGCTLDQMCLNEATAPELKTLKWVGKKTSEDFVAMRDASGHCLRSVDDLQNANGEMEGWGLKKSTRTAFKRASNTLIANGKIDTLCVECGCAMCAPDEMWNTNRTLCESRCADGYVWREESCVDASASPDVMPPSIDDDEGTTTTTTSMPTASVVRFDETPKQVRYSPTPKAAVRGVWHAVQERLKAARSSIDVAMFSFSDITHRKQLIAAAERGVKVRVVMQTSTCSSCKYCKELIEGTAHLTRPIEVRFVTPTMHNKFTVIDYDDLNQTPTRECVVATGSCNWSVSSAIRYDEDWLAFEGDLAPRTIRAYKQEFEWLWAYSRPCGGGEADVSSPALRNGWIQERVDFDGCFTSYNMRPVLRDGNWGFEYLDADTTGACNAKMIEAIDSARVSIQIAHTYFRSEVVYEAVRRRLRDGITVQIIADGKEFRNSNNLPIDLAEEGADVRYKYYARGWDFSCAQQMHMKFFLIDAELASQGGCVVVTGSENLSEGSEKKTFENVVLSRTPWVCDAYEAQFQKLLNYGIETNENRADALARYDEEATCFFSPITLSGNEIKSLRNSIDCRLRIGEYDGAHPDGECTFWGDRRPVLCFQRWYDEPCPAVTYTTVATGDNPDLAITNFELPSSAFNVGASLVGTSCTVTNNGTVASQSVKMQFLASRSANPEDPTATQLSYKTIPVLQPGESFTGSPSLNFGAGHDLGTFRIICFADSDGVLLELAKDNNLATVELLLEDRDLSRNASDLVWHTAGLVDAEPYGEIVVGETMQFYGTVENVGNRPTVDTTDVDSSTGLPEQIMANVYISSDRFWDSGPVREGGDKQIGWVRIDPLGVGERTDEIDKTVRMTVPGTWYVIAVVDNGRAVREQIELNNIWISSVPWTVHEAEDGDGDGGGVVVGPAPDLVVRDLRLEGSVGESGLVPYGERVTFSSVVVNQGDADMSDATDSSGGSCRQGEGLDCARMKYYFYEGPGINVVDTDGKTAEAIKNEYGMRYWYYERISALASNASESHEQSRSISESSFDSGCWSLFAFVDYENDYEERDESNNFAFVDFELNSDSLDPALPDLSGSMRWSGDDAWPARTAPLGARIDVNLSLSLDISTSLSPTSLEIRFYLSRALTADTSARCAGAGSSSDETFLTAAVVSTEDFDASGRFDLLRQVRMPVNVDERSYALVAKLDSRDALVESRESNNVVVSTLTVENVPGAQNERVGMPAYMQVMENKNHEHCPSIIKLDAKLFDRPSIGFWNLLHLSARTQTERNRREWNIISCVAAHFDVLAVLELEDEAALQYLAKKACDVTTDTDCDCSKPVEGGPSTCDWDWHVAPHESGRNSVCEYVGFVWNKRGGSGAQIVRPIGYYNEGVNDTMKREPYGARFRIGTFDFTMVGVHQRHGGHVSYRQAEAEHSGDVFSQFLEADCGSERDVFYGGDMNLDASDVHWSLLHDETYAYLNAEYGVDPAQGTTLARTSDRTITDNAFDQVFWSARSNAAIDEAGAFDFTSPEIMSIHGGDTPGSNIYTTVSDHIPVYVILSEDVFGGYVDADDDVSCPNWAPWPPTNSTSAAAVRNREDCPADP